MDTQINQNKQVEKYELHPVNRTDFTSAGVIFVSGNYLLVVQGIKTGKWSFPKGHREGGEDAITTAKRELKEETGHEILPTDKFCTVRTYRYNYHGDGDDVYDVYHYFVFFRNRNKFKNSKMTVGDNEVSARWIHMDQLASDKYDTNRAVNQYVLGQLNYIKNKKIQKKS